MYIVIINVSVYCRMDLLYIINKSTFSTSVYRGLVAPNAVALAFGENDVIYGTDGTDLVRMSAGMYSLCYFVNKP